MDHGDLVRFALIAVLLVVLAGLFVWAGTIEPDPADNNFPGNDEVFADPDEYVGQQVSVGGTVVNTNPLTVETTVEGERVTFIVENANLDVSTGDQLSAFGTLQSDHTVTATNVVHREPWEAHYMYAVSFLAGLWVLARLLNRWTVDTDHWTVIPRTEPYITLRK